MDKKRTAKADPLITHNLVTAHLNMYSPTTAQLAYIDALILRVQSFVEDELGRDFTSTTWTVTTDHWQQRYIEHLHGYMHHHPRNTYYLKLPRSPVQSINTVKYYDTSNHLVTMYDKDDPTTTSNIRLVGDTIERDCPPHLYHRGDALQVSFVSGYTALPPNAEEAMLLLIGTWFFSREDEVLGQAGSPGTFQLSVGLERILDQLRKGDFA